MNTFHEARMLALTVGALIAGSPELARANIGNEGALRFVPPPEAPIFPSATAKPEREKAVELVPFATRFSGVTTNSVRGTHELGERLWPALGKHVFFPADWSTQTCYEAYCRLAVVHEMMRRSESDASRQPVPPALRELGYRPVKTAEYLESSAPFRWEIRFTSDRGNSALLHNFDARFDDDKLTLHLRGDWHKQAFLEELFTVYVFGLNWGTFQYGSRLGVSEFSAVSLAHDADAQHVLRVVPFEHVRRASQAAYTMVDRAMGELSPTVSPDPSRWFSLRGLPEQFVRLGSNLERWRSESEVPKGAAKQELPR